MLLSLFWLMPPSPSKIWDEDASIAFRIGGFEVKWYGILVALGFIAAIVLAITKLKFWYKIKVDPFYYFCLMGIPLAIFGARFWSCCLGDAEWSSFFNLRDGGLAVQGGVIFDILLAIWWFPFILKKPKYHVRDILLTPEQPVVRQVSMWLYADAILPCILIGQIIGRWGNYFNQELYGSIITPSESNMWYLNFLAKFLPYMYISNSYVHPLFLYEGIINFVGLIFIYIIMEYIPKIKAGTIGLSYVIWYSIARLSLEGLRASDYKFIIPTYTMCGLWLGMALILLVLNQCNIIPKTRKYRCKFLIYESFIHATKLFFNKFSLKINRAKLNKEQKEEWQDIEDINKLEAKINFLSQKWKNIEDRYQKAKSSSIRTNYNYLYYLGK